MTKGEQARLTAWRLRVLQHAAAEQNVARVCRRSEFPGNRSTSGSGDMPSTATPSLVGEIRHLVINLVGGKHRDHKADMYIIDRVGTPIIVRLFAVPSIKVVFAECLRASLST
jgi:hypothetical protein